VTTSFQEIDSYVKNKGIKVSVKELPNGHVQIKGNLLVNYYPDSKDRTAYVAGTREGFKHVGHKQAVTMALKIPVIKKNNKPRKSNRKRRMKLLANSPYCYWCIQKGSETKLTLETSTADHVIPLHRGGLDNMNNIVLSCEPCNTERGHDMPEIKRKWDKTP